MRSYIFSIPVSVAFEVRADDRPAAVEAAQRVIDCLHAHDAPFVDVPGAYFPVIGASGQVVSELHLAEEGEGPVVDCPNPNDT